MLRKIIEIYDRWATHGLTTEPKPNERRLLRVAFAVFIAGGVPALVSAIDAIAHGYRLVTIIIAASGSVVAVIGLAVQFIAAYRVNK